MLLQVLQERLILLIDKKREPPIRTAPFFLSVVVADPCICPASALHFVGGERRGKGELEVVVGDDVVFVEGDLADGVDQRRIVGPAYSDVVVSPALYSDAMQSAFP